MAFLGMRGTGDWETGQDPENWNEMVMFEFPNGDAPVTAILGMMDAEQITSTVHNWWEETDPAMAGAVSNIYVNSAMTTAYVYATHQVTFGIANATVYVKVAAAVAQEMNGGATVLLIDTDRPDAAVLGKVTAVLVNGANSRLTVKLEEADDNGAAAATYNLSTVDYIQISGHKQAQGSPIPTSVHYNPSPFSNYAQILEEPFNITRTARKTKLRTEAQYEADKRKANYRLAKKREMAFLNGVLSTRTGDNGEPELGMQGIIPALRAYEAANSLGLISDYRYDTDFAGKTWKQGGEDWLDAKLEVYSRWAPGEVMGLIGSTAAAGINTLAKAGGQIQLEPGPNNAYGMKTRTYVAEVVCHLKTHPMFSRYAYSRGRMLLFDPGNIKRKFIDDVFFKPDPNKDQGGSASFDGTNESFLVEETLEYNFPKQFLLLEGVGSDSEL